MALFLFQSVRDATARVVHQARFVRVNEDRLGDYAASLPLDEIKAPSLDTERHYLDHGRDTLAFFLMLDAINFGSGYFPRLRKRPGSSGYFTVATHLTEHFRKHGPFSPDELARIGPDECATIFGQDSADPDISELMQRFATALNDLGRYVRDQFGGSYEALVEEAHHSAHRLCELLIRMPYFNDVELYEAESGASFHVPFYKRAQITSADLALAFGGTGYGRFDDLDQMTMFADNLVPHVLRIDGVLSYDEGLADRIDREVLIPIGSPEEIEIRASAVYAVERLVGILRGRGEQVNAMGLDYLLWHRGQRPEYKQAKPRHRSRTVFY